MKRNLRQRFKTKKKSRQINAGQKTRQSFVYILVLTRKEKLAKLPNDKFTMKNTKPGNTVVSAAIVRTAADLA